MTKIKKKGLNADAKLILALPSWEQNAKFLSYSKLFSQKIVLDSL